MSGTSMRWNGAADVRNILSLERSLLNLIVICVGCNHHHKTSPETWDNKPITPCPEEEGEDSPFDTGDYNPEGKRLWSWLILCDDGTIILSYWSPTHVLTVAGTVISIHEPLGSIKEQKDILTVRRNMLTVFRSLSLSDAAKAHGKSESTVSLGYGLDDLPFRRQQPQRESENVHGGPSLLLYYLFDDWHSSYDFVLGRGAPYSTQMRELRNQMHKDPQLKHLSKLHRLSRQLAILKRMYETKKIIVDNILNRQENVTSKANGQPQPIKVEKDPNDDRVLFAMTMGDSEILGVPLQPLSIAKFERLRDRIALYVLGELEALLSEKNELETLTFNLISLKQSTTVELLTRVTIWFAGVTFVFLPLTLVTGYFSMQLNDTNGKYSLRTFWGTSGVAVALTLAVLYTVGKSTGTMRLSSVWRSIKKVWFSWLQKKRAHKRKKEKVSKEE
jgi:Mg2+ and Co2+ transporter CorA